MSKMNSGHVAEEKQKMVLFHEMDKKIIDLSREVDLTGPEKEGVTVWGWLVLGMFFFPPISWSWGILERREFVN